MKKIILITAVAGLAGMSFGQAAFLPKHLAVLRAGDGVISLHLKQSPAFVDEFAPGTFNDKPELTVAIPTNGTDSIFFNGHAATEGMLSRSADGHLLAFAGCGGNLLAQSGTPSLLDIGRGLCTVDAAGKSHTIIYEQYDGTAKMNPRGAVTDGQNHFWTCGNANGTAYYDAGAGTMKSFNAIPDSRQVKIIGGALYTTLDGPDAIFVNTDPGIFSFTEKDGDAASLPNDKDTTLKLLVPAGKDYNKVAGFDLSADGTIAYMADVNLGIQKYVKADGTWKFAYNFSIPQNIPEAKNNEDGCFAVAVDFSGKAPVIYATTTEGWGGAVNSNRVVQIVDTGASSKVTTIAQAPSAEIVYRGIDFTPEK